MASQQAFSLRWNDYSTHIGEAFESLRYEEDLVDVTLYCEGRRIRAHKMMLSACSSYFKDVFKENPCQHPIIIFKNVRYADLVSLVEFMYRGEVNVLQDSLQSFLRTAEMLSVRGLADNGNTDPLQTHGGSVSSSSLAQQILQTHTQNMNNAAITTPQSVFITIPSNSSVVSSVKIEQEQVPQTVIPQQNNLQLQQPKQRRTQTFSQPQTTTSPPGQQLLSSSQQQQQQQQHRIQLKSGRTIAIATIGQRIGMENATVQLDPSNPSSTALQELVQSVVSTAQLNREKRLPNQNESLATASNQTNSNEQLNEGLEIYQHETHDHEQDATYAELQTTDMKLHMTEFLSVNDSGLTTTTTTTAAATMADSAIATTSGENEYAEPESLELVCENVGEQSDMDEPIDDCNVGMETEDLKVHTLIPVDELPSKAKSNQPQKKHKCIVCDKSFCAWKSLIMHQQIHNGRTKCEICGAILSRTANLKRHMKLKHEP